MRSGIGQRVTTPLLGSQRKSSGSSSTQVKYSTDSATDQTVVSPRWICNPGIGSIFGEICRMRSLPLSTHRCPAFISTDGDGQFIPAPLEARRQPHRLLHVEAIGRHAAQELLHQDAQLQARQMHADTEMLAVAESQLALDAAVPDEAVRLFELVVVAPRRAEQHHDALAGLDVMAGDG